MSTVDVDEPTRFSATIRQATWSDHGHAEHAPVMAALVGGGLPLDGYALLLAQLRQVYAALESVAARMSDDPVASAFVDPALARVTAIEADLDHIAGSGWDERLPVMPATMAYRDRLLDGAGASPLRFVAHHYTRYLGDLSGGQHIGRVVRRVYGFEDGPGADLYRFDGIADLALFKDAYRARLDTAPWTEAERAVVLDEVRLAYRLNTELAAGLGDGGGRW